MNGDVRNFYSELGVELPNGGTDVAVACFADPGAHAHGDRNKSMSVNVETGFFNCHGCGEKGDGYHAALKVGRAPLAAVELLKRHGLFRESDSAPAPRQASPPKAPAVSESDIAGWRDALSAKPDALAKLETLRGWSPDVLARLGVGVNSAYASTKGGGAITFPTRDAQGTLTGCVHYAPDPAKRSGSKSIAKGPRQLFPAPESIEGDTVWLCEGEPDAVAAQSIGLPAVAVPGVEGWKDGWRERFARFERVLICVDDDPPGERLAAKLAASIAHAARVDMATLASGERGTGYDITDAILEAQSNGGVAHLRKMLESAASSAEPKPSTVDTPKAETPADDWPVLRSRELPKFPTDALPPSVARWVEAAATESETPVDLAALSALGTLAAAAMGSAVVDCGAWEEELGLYLLVSLPSGDRKSSVLQLATAPLRQAEDDYRREAGPEIRTQRNRKAVLEKREAKLVTECASALDEADRRVLEGELTEVTTELAEIGEPVPPRLLADDATPEALGRLLAQHGSIAVLAAESAFLDNIGGRHSKDGGPNLHLVCKSYTGESTTIDRKSHEPETIERPLVTITLAVQPHVLAKLVGNDIGRKQGLVGRFAYAMPTTELGLRKIVGVERIAPAVREGWTEAVSRLFDLKRRDTNDRNTTKRSTDPLSVISVTAFDAPRLKLASGASVLLDQLRLAQEPRLGEGGDLHSIADWIARHAGRIARIAGLLHLVEHEPELPIGVETMEQALRIGEYLLAHAICALGDEDPLTRRAVRWLEARGEGAVSLRELHRGPARDGGAEDAELLAITLERVGALRALPEPPKAGPGRSPSKRYEVHPDLRSER